MKKAKTEAPKIHHVQVSDDLWELLTARAKQELRSPAAQAGYMLRQLLTEGDANE